VILSTIVTTLVNRFLDLLIQDYQKWALADGSRATGSLLGYQPDLYVKKSGWVTDPIPQVTGCSFCSGMRIGASRPKMERRRKRNRCVVCWQLT
jgi:hypothetical protein